MRPQRIDAYFGLGSNPDPPVPEDAVVGADHAILLDTEHVFPRPADIGHERRAGLGRRHRKMGIVIGHEAVLEEPIGGRHGLDPGHTQLLQLSVL
jgi:hypothetical protein